MKSAFGRAAVLLFFLIIYQNCDSAVLDSSGKKSFSSAGSGGTTGGSSGLTSGGSTGASTGGTSGANTGTNYLPITSSPTTDEEEADAIDCGGWNCAPHGDYTCAAEWDDQEWHDVFMEAVNDAGCSQVATMDCLDALEPLMNVIGVIFARNSAGILRGRIYLPSFDYCARWERAYDVITAWDGQWAWTPRGNKHW